MPRKRRVNAEPEEFIVKVARTGGRVVEVSVEAGATVEDALEASGIDYSSTDRIRKNGNTADFDATVSQNDVITVAGKIKGGVL